MEYQQSLRAAEDYSEDFEVDPQLSSFEADPKFEAVSLERGGQGTQYEPNFWSPKSDELDPIPLIYFAIQLTEPKKLEEAQ